MKFNTKIKSKHPTKINKGKISREIEKKFKKGINREQFNEEINKMEFNKIIVNF